LLHVEENFGWLRKWCDGAKKRGDERQGWMVVTHSESFYERRDDDEHKMNLSTLSAEPFIESERQKSEDSWRFPD
jgi:hypothetical protein